MNSSRKAFRPSAETLEKARIVKKFIETKYTTLYEEEKLRKQYIDSLIHEMKKIQATKEEQVEAQRELEKKEVEVWRSRRQKMKISDFTSEAIIGKGAFGEVRLCREHFGENAGRLVAIKKMKKEEMIKKNQSKHVIAEREILAQADNKWIVDLFSSFTDAENLYLVMEYLPGGDLMNQLIKRDIFDEEETRFYMVELVLAIESVHKLNYIHRDIKPDNILLDRSGHIKLSDFGLCKYYENENSLSSLFEKKLKKSAEKLNELSTMKNSAERREMRKKYHRTRKKVYSMVGTIDYIAPEVFSKKGYTELVDWWSLGTIMFEMMVGYPPFVAGDAAKTCHKIIEWQKNFDIPEDVKLSRDSEDLIRRLIENPDKRLGVNGVDEIKKHPFFKGVDWESYADTAMPPHRPKLKGETDVSNFDDFEDDGTWVPAQSTKSIKRRGQQYEYESLFIGYSFKKEVDPMMNKHVETIVNELRKKKAEEMKRNASQDQITKNSMVKMDKLGNFKKGSKNMFKIGKKRQSGKGERMDVLDYLKGGLFKTVDHTGSSRPAFNDAQLRKHMFKKGGKKNYNNQMMERSGKKGEKVQMMNIAKGPPKNLTSSKASANGFKKQSGKMKLSRKKSLKSKFSPSKKKISHKKIQKQFGKSGVSGKSDMMGMKKDFSNRNDLVDVGRGGVINVYKQNPKREQTNSLKKKYPIGKKFKTSKFTSNKEKTSRESRKKFEKKLLGHSHTDRDKKPSMKKFSTEKTQYKKGFLKKYPTKESLNLKKKYSKLKDYETHDVRKSKKGSIGKTRLKSGKTAREEFLGSKKGMIKTIAGGFYPKKEAKLHVKNSNKNLGQRLYYSNAKSKGGDSSRYIDKKNTQIESMKKLKMTSSQVKRESKEMLIGAKQYRSNIYDQ
jgi:serine/threonine kinase 38